MVTITNTGENIRNAVMVLYKTYENVYKLMEDCKRRAKEAGYIVAVDKFLRWKSDGDSDGWLLNSFILLFQSEQDQECESGNGWRDGPIYAVEICLARKSEPDVLPELLISAFDYEDTNGWSEGCSPASYWVFQNPVHITEAFKGENRDGYTISIPTQKKYSDMYWGLKAAWTKRFLLTDITADNLKDKVFVTFDTLMEKMSRDQKNAQARSR